MASQPPFKARKRMGDDAPGFRKLSEMMNQGGGYSHASPPRSLSAQMGQPGGYSHGDNCKKLRNLMNQ
jgi:hypothetical protein